jgi:hypothetical protein
LNDQGVEEALWQEMKTYAEANGLVGGNYKLLNLPFETSIMSQPQAVRQRIEKRVEGFVHHLLTEVFNASDTAPLVVDAILKQQSPDPGPKAQRIEDPADWTPQQITAKAAFIGSDKGPAGDYDD